MTDASSSDRSPPGRSHALESATLDAHQVETCRCSRHLSLDAHAAYLDCSSLLAQVHACGGREAQATSLLVGNVASALKVRGHASLCTQGGCEPMYPRPQRCSSAAALRFQVEPYVLQVHGAQSAVTGKVMDALMSHGVSTYMRLMG